jgi:pantetheine-phosphate adenylyltransferase
MADKVIYPGTFDPVTFGHIDIIKRCVKLFDEVVIAVAINDDKNPLFNVEERVELINQSIKGMNSVKVVSFSGLLVEYAKELNINTVIRGIRAFSDFEFEFQMALTNRKLCDEVETIFMMPNEQYSYISSRAIKEICKLGGDVNCFVPECVSQKLKEKI